MTYRHINHNGKDYLVKMPVVARPSGFNYEDGLRTNKDLIAYQKDMAAYESQFKSALIIPAEHLDFFKGRVVDEGEFDEKYAVITPEGNTILKKDASLMDWTCLEKVSVAIPITKKLKIMIMELEKPEEERQDELCWICGGKMVLIRGRYPGHDKRSVCPTCVTERLEQILEIASPNYRKAYKNENHENT